MVGPMAGSAVTTSFVRKAGDGIHVEHGMRLSWWRSAWGSGGERTEGNTRGSTQWNTNNQVLVRIGHPEGATLGEASNDHSSDHIAAVHYFLFTPRRKVMREWPRLD
jgi:hypothetical protein